MSLIPLFCFLFVRSILDSYNALQSENEKEKRRKKKKQIKAALLIVPHDKKQRLFDFYFFFVNKTNWVGGVRFKL